MVERIILIRKNKGLSQEAFAEKLGLSRNFINQVENGKKKFSERTISDICKQFGVNKEWILTGKGEMYEGIEDEVADIVSELLGEDNPFYELILGIMKTYQSLDPKSQELLRNLGKQLLDNLKKGD